jgi:hypothetical protein
MEMGPRRSRHNTRRNRGCVRNPYWFVIMLVFTTCMAALASCSGSSDPIQTARNEGVLFVPPVEAGEGGWCLTTGDKACKGGEALKGPIVGEAWSGSGGHPPIRIGVVVTTSEVSAVSVEGGEPIATRIEGVLPDGLRAAVAEIQGGRHFRRVPGFNISAPEPASFVPLGRDGKPIYQDRRSQAPLLFVEPTQGWTWPASVPRGVCAIHIRHLDGLRVEKGGVVTHLEHRSGLVGRPLLSCATTAYELNGSSIFASVLVDAGDPGSSPAPLPGMKSLAEHPRVFQAPVAEGEAVARRIPDAWLVVADGGGFQQRLTLLEHLRATIHL